jgi:hypothetical protein
MRELELPRIHFDGVGGILEAVPFGPGVIYARIDQSSFDRI